MSEIVLSTGRVLDANRGIIGIAAGDDDVYGGYDQTCVSMSGYCSLTVAERVELADRMIALWQAWKSAVPRCSNGRPADDGHQHNERDECLPPTSEFAPAAPVSPAPSAASAAAGPDAGAATSPQSNAGSEAHDG